MDYLCLLEHFMKPIPKTTPGGTQFSRYRSHPHSRLFHMTQTRTSLEPRQLDFGE